MGRISHPFVLWGLLLSGMLSGPVQAADRYWACDSGQWTDPCWSPTLGGIAQPSGIPSAGDHVFLLRSDAIDRSITYSSASLAGPLQILRIDALGDGSMTLRQNSDGLNVSEVFLGSDTQSQVPGKGVLRYELSGLAQLSNERAWIGIEGRDGRFVQTGGRHLSGTMAIGTGEHVQAGGLPAKASKGRYELQAGELQSDYIYLGGSGGTGVFTQSGGLHQAGTLELGPAPGGSGTYQLLGGHLDVAGTLYLGYGGDGRFEMSGGKLDAFSIVVSVGGGSSVGHFQMSGGIARAQRFSVGNGGSLNLTGGSRNFSAAPRSDAARLNTAAADPLVLQTDLQQHGDMQIQGVVVVDGSVVNGGTMQVTAADLRVTGRFDNQSAYLSAFSDSNFTDLAISEAGYLIGGIADRFFVSGRMDNRSARGDLWDTVSSSLLLNGAAPQTMSLAASDLGARDAGYEGNFAWGAFSLAAGVDLTLEDANSEPGAALYVGVLTLGGGLAQIDDIHSAFNIYYDPRLAGNAYLSGGHWLLDGGGQLMAAVPEPGGSLLLLAGLYALCARFARSPPISQDHPAQAGTRLQQLNCRAGAMTKQ